MTREEAIGNLRYAKQWKDRPTDEALDMAIEALKQEQKIQWIPVSEKLPERHGSYLVTWNTGKDLFPINDFLLICQYEPTNEYDFKANWFKGDWELDDLRKTFPDCRVTAWMPLPEAYEEIQD